jgi:hypothetical protein
VAAKKWGRSDYRQAAVELAGCIYQHCIHPQTHMPLIGDWADPGDDAYLLTRPSDFILSGYLIFYYVSFWQHRLRIKGKAAYFFFLGIYVGRYSTSTAMG